MIFFHLDVESSVQIFASHQGIDRSSNLSFSGFNNDPSASITWPVQVGTAQGQCYDAFGGLRENQEKWADGYFKYECREGHRNPIGIN